MFDKTVLLAGPGQAPVIPRQFGPYLRFSSITPASPLDDGTQGIDLVTISDQTSYGFLLRVTSPDQATLRFQPFPLGKFTPLAGLPQKGSTTPVDGGDNRVQDAFEQSGLIHFAFNDGCASDISSATVGCLRFVAIDPATATVTDEKEDSLAQGVSVFYPAIRPESGGHLIEVFGYSSPNDYPGLAVSVDPGSSNSYTTLAQGVAPNESGRWGDYFSAASDPTNPSRVWVAGAYATPKGWSTTIAALSLAPFSINPPPGQKPQPTPKPSDTTPPRVHAQPSRGIAGSNIRLTYYLSDNSSVTHERVRIRHLGRLIATIPTRSSRIVNGSPYYVVWHAPRTAPPILSASGRK